MINDNQFLPQNEWEHYVLSLIEETDLIVQEHQSIIDEIKKEQRYKKYEKTLV